MELKTIVLVGFMGAGKSTIARNLSQRIGLPLVELDELIENEAGKSIPLLFEEDGEEYFRDQETKLLFKYLQNDRVIISTGGGIVERPENILRVKECGFSIYLQAGWDTICRRVGTGQGRPLANDSFKMKRLFERRKPLYEQADLVIDTNDKKPDAVVQEILSKLENNQSV